MLTGLRNIYKLKNALKSYVVYIFNKYSKIQSGAACKVLMNVVLFSSKWNRQSCSKTSYLKKEINMKRRNMTMTQVQVEWTFTSNEDYIVMISETETKPFDKNIKG